MFIWDGSNLGNIDNLVSEYIEDQFLILINKELVRIYAYENSIPLIADELKFLFNIVKIGRHRALYKNKDVILCRIEGHEENFTLKEGIYCEDVQKSLIFRWALGLTSRGEHPLILRTYKSGLVSVTSYIDTSITHEEWRTRGSKLSSNMINKWFNNPYDVNIILNSLFKRTELYETRIKIENIIKRIDNQYCWWNTFIISRIQTKID